MNKNRYALIFFCAFILLLPLLVKEYFLHILIMGGIWVILATGLGIIAGYTGQFSFAQGAFFGIGAYSSALLVMKLNLSFWLAFWVAAVITAILGALIGLVALRLKGPYFAVTTLGFQQIIGLIFINWLSLTNGSEGLIGIPQPESINLPYWTINFDSKTYYYYFVVVIIAFMFLCLDFIIKGKWGKAFIAIREDETLAKALGINPMKYKTISFSLSSFFAGLGGSLFAHYAKFITPDSFSIGQSFDAFVMLIVGGSGSLFGPGIGAIVLILIPEYLHAIKEFRMIAYGFILVLFVIFLPSGVYGLKEPLRRMLKRI